jgi:diaminohydroxyphosphoribosylaminopyrimidine deaminase/5-amino-6-(5-phosphoribosylamino)uracil reductase
MTKPLPNNPDDHRWMSVALALARRGLGTVAPNPAVGCVLIKDGTVVGRGWTQPGGRPHAETEALIRAGDEAKGATAYVSLEPCSHHGKTPPCADALIDAGVARIVVACADPDERVSGAGLAALEAAGIEVTSGVLEAEARQINAGFMRVKSGGRPFVTLKVATTLDGQIATATGESQWITGPAARAQVHRLRAAHDAVLTGMGTVRADDPELTVRLPGLPLAPPVRVVLASDAEMEPSCKLCQTRETAPVWLVVPEGKGKDIGGITVLETPEAEGRPDIAGALDRLAEQGITRVLIEAGATVAASALQAGVVDRICWFRAAKMIGGDGRSVTDALGIASLEQAPGFTRRDIRSVGDDTLEIYEKAA